MIQRPRDAPRHAIAVGIVVKNGRALVARRPPGTHLEGTWEFPGGKVRCGESCEEALRREFHEEVGLGFETAREIRRLEHRYSDRTVLLTFFLCRGTQGTPVGREHQELRWVDADELDRLSTPEANRVVIRDLREILIRESASP